VIGETIGNFKVVKRLGTGGMGEVWLGEQQSIGTHVAIKLMNADVSRDTEHVQRFFNEARAVSRIQHAGIVKIFDVGTHGGRAYLIMEYLDGETLGQRMKRGRLPFGQIGEIGRQIATVLDATHTAGITHRDLKPDNIFLVPDRELGERVKILDFGIAKLSGTLAGASPRTMGTMGTPAYMAPEQWGDTSKVDWRADLYSLGCVAFEMTTGRVPFIAMTIAEACGQHLNAEPPTVSSLAPSVPASLEKLIARLLEKDPAKRPASMKDVANAFAAVDKQALGTAPTITTDPVSLPAAPREIAKKSRALPILVGLLMLAAGAGASVYLLRPKTATPGPSDAAVTTTTADEPQVRASAEPRPAAPKPPPPTPAPTSDAAPASPTLATPPTPPSPPDAAALDAAATGKPKPNAKEPSDAGVPDAAATGKTKPNAKTPSDAGVPDAAPAGKPKPNPKNGATPAPETPGGADAEQLQQAVRARSAQTTACYEAAVKDDPTLGGMVSLQITIDGNGHVTRATADGLNEAVQECLIAQVKSIKFPKPADPPVSLIVPFRFQRE
jgi:serine/threonine-protein kinase